jgi:hypothetical protein
MKQWFNHKLVVAPPVVDLTAQGAVVHARRSEK